MGFSIRRLLSTFTLIVGLSPWATAGVAAPPATAPAEVVQVLKNIEAAANQHDLEQVMRYYGQGFDSDTGFNHDRLRQTLAELWQQYPTLDYEIQLLAWEATGADSYTIETLTRVKGLQTLPDRQLRLVADVTSRQQLQRGQVTYQQILTETSRLSSGSRPPTVRIQLPPTLVPGQAFPFDAVVAEPLAGRSLMGAAVDEAVKVDGFLVPRSIVLDVLSGGGLYKVGVAPTQPSNRWISAVLLREDGLVVETRRISVGP
ncbi:MAG: nuclear transport factor 2 family protein [Cyanobacteria bacterium REEB459]|nr:nuclear transport factor 2 family protein [Cyanobacteria bacterium REEB459]